MPLMFLVARIDHAMTRGINWLTTCLVERARGYDSSEAGDFLEYVDALAEREAEQEVAEPSYVEGPHGWRHIVANGKGGSYALTEPPSRATSPEFVSVKMPDGSLRTERLADIAKDITRHQRFFTGIDAAVETLTQTPTAGQRGESPAGDDSPTSPAGSPEHHHCDCGLSDDMDDLDDHAVGCTIWDDVTTCYFCGNPTVNVVNTDCDGDTELVCKKCAADELGALPMPTDPSPTIASRQHQPSVRGEGSPADSDIPPSPAGERPTPGEFAAVAVCEVLAEHAFSFPNHSSIGMACHCRCGARPVDEYDWREHVSAEIQRRIDAAIASQ